MARPHAPITVLSPMIDTVHTLEKFAANCPACAGPREGAAPLSTGDHYPSALGLALDRGHDRRGRFDLRGHDLTEYLLAADRDDEPSRRTTNRFSPSSCGCWITSLMPRTPTTSRLRCAASGRRSEADGLYAGLGRATHKRVAIVRRADRGALANLSMSEVASLGPDVLQCSTGAKCCRLCASGARSVHRKARTAGRLSGAAFGRQGPAGCVDIRSGTVLKWGSVP